MLSLWLRRERQEKQHVDVTVLLDVGEPLVAVAVANSEVRLGVRAREVGERAGENYYVIVERSEAGSPGERVALERLRQAGASKRANQSQRVVSRNKSVPLLFRMMARRCFPLVSVTYWTCSSRASRRSRWAVKIFLSLWTTASDQRIQCIQRSAEQQQQERGQRRRHTTE